MIRLQLSLLISILLLAACDRQQDAVSDAGPGAESRPRETKRVRPVRTPVDEEPPLAPRAALARAEALDSPEERIRALSELAWSTLESDTEVCAQVFAMLPAESVERLRLIEHFAMRRAEEHPDEAIEWAESLGSENEISTAKCQIALVLAESDPARAAGILSECGIEGRDFDVKVVGVIQRWAQKSPSEAASWVAQFQAGPARTDGLREIVSCWINRDSQAFMAWKDQLTDPTVKQDVLNALVGLASRDSVAPPMDQADPELRHAIRQPAPRK